MKRLFLIISTIVLSCAFIAVRAQDSSYQSTAPEDSPVYHTTDYKFYRYRKDGIVEWDKTIHSGLTMGKGGLDFIIKQDGNVIKNVSFTSNEYVKINYDLTKELYHITALQETQNPVFIMLCDGNNNIFDTIKVTKIKQPEISSNDVAKLNERIRSLESTVLKQTKDIDNLYIKNQTLIDSIKQHESKNLKLSQEKYDLLIEKENYLDEVILRNRIIVIIITIFILIFIFLFIKNRKLYVRTKDLSSELNTSKQQLERNTNIISNNNISDTNNNYIVVNELKKQIEQLQLEISTLKNENSLLQKELDELNTLKQQFEEKTSTIPNNNIGNTDELKKTINTNGEEITEEKKNNVVQYTQEHNSFSLYSDFIVDGIFNKVTETPNEDTVYELILDNGNGCSASVIIYQGAYSRILANRSFIDGCEIQIVGKNEVCIEKDGLAEKDNNGKWKLVRVPSIVIK
mgnify:CR=1 FL=1